MGRADGGDYKAGPQEKAKMAEMAKSLLGICSKFLNSIRFVVEGEVVGEIDRWVIDRVTDWSKAGVDQQPLAGTWQTFNRDRGTN